MQLQIWRCLILYQDVSRGHRLVIIVLLSALSFASFGGLISISTPPLKLLIKIFRMRCRIINRHPVAQLEDYGGLDVCPGSFRFSLHSRKHHTRGVDRFPTRLPPTIRPKCPWSGTWISLH